ncbi:MAG: ribonuclease 3 [Lysobacteraceae bacterium]|nr:MAG: ribonuclease 3 [Xanthomonadaceae bacterium]
MKALGYTFQNTALRDQALTHRSAGRRHNERLEFLGDGILNFVIAEALFRKFPDAPEGDLSRLRARLVRGETLAKVATELDLGKALIMGSGEMKSGGQRRSSILADVVEALLGAIYIDGGFAPCRETILRLFAERLINLPPADELKDPKTRLQEWLQGRGHPVPEYSLIDSWGEEHQRTFRCQCKVKPDPGPFYGEGRSRRKAEQLAAMAALERLKK